VRFGTDAALPRMFCSDHGKASRTEEGEVESLEGILKEGVV
jgi:hypothetical protein